MASRAADESSHRVERLAKPESGAAQVNRRDIGDQGVPRRTPDTLADPIDEPGGYKPADTVASGNTGFVNAARP